MILLIVQITKLVTTSFPNLMHEKLLIHILHWGDNCACLTFLVSLVLFCEHKDLMPLQLMRYLTTLLRYSHKPQNFSHFSHLSLQFFLTGTVLGQKFWLWISNPVPTLEAPSIYWRWTLWVSSLHSWAFHLRSLHWVLRVSPVPGLWYFIEVLSTYHLIRLHISINSAGPLGFFLALLPYMILFFLSPPPSLPAQIPPFLLLPW